MSTNESRGSRIAQHLIQIGAVTFSPEQPFRWASGLLSPIYCDNRLTLAHPDVRNEIASGFLERIGDFEPRVEAVIGVATGAIAHASFVAARSGLPMGYIRSSAKDYGRGNRIEGFVREGARVAVIEDLISTGASSLSAVEGVRDAGMAVAGVVAVVSYGFPFAHDSFTEAGVELQTLVTFEQLLSAALAAGQFGSHEEDRLLGWQSDPKAWSESHSG